MVGIFLANSFELSARITVFELAIDQLDNDRILQFRFRGCGHNAGWGWKPSERMHQQHILWGELRPPGLSDKPGSEPYRSQSGYKNHDPSKAGHIELPLGFESTLAPIKQNNLTGSIFQVFW